MFLQDVGDGSAGYTMPKVGERTLDSGIPPTRILPCNTDREIRDLFHDPRSARSPSSGTVIPFHGNQFSVPGHDRIGRDYGGDLAQDSVADGLASYRQSASLVIGETKALLSDLLLQYTILLLEVVDYALLISVDPASK